MKETEKELCQLFEKYIADTCNREEFDRLLNLVEKSESEPTLHHLLKRQWDAGAPRTTRKTSYRKWYAAAAVILVLLTTALFLWKPEKETAPLLSQRKESDVLPIATRIKLPDGSNVILRDGSQLDMHPSFEGNTREVSLEGEAYFDIAPLPEKPFIIHTGHLKTTVLGTAFFIKANPTESLITVTVTRGKVKVENEKTLLAVLEADKQLIYHAPSNHVSEKTVDAEKEAAWKSHDLIFRNSPFETIVQELSHLYEVRITFDDDFLKQRRITASLDDRDSIETILDILCTAQHAYYIMEGGTYIVKSLKNSPYKE
jgi:ferric-dicitrate binding protein FerR (iron transport regulator)